ARNVSSKIILKCRVRNKFSAQHLRRGALRLEALLLSHQAVQFLSPVLDEHDGKIVTVLHHQKASSIGRDVFALMSHQVERVRTVKQLDGHAEAQWRLARHACPHDLFAKPEKEFTAVR